MKAIDEMHRKDPKMDPCDALQLMLDDDKAAGDTQKVKRSERMQKGYGCRNAQGRRPWKGSIRMPCDSDNERWYLADIIEQITVEGEARSIVHVNFTLVRAHSGDEAFDKAVAAGKSGEATYENTEGRKVTVAFRGLRDLTLIAVALEDGAELAYQELTGLSAAEVHNLISPRSSLAVFSDTRRQGPNYLDSGIVAEAEGRFGVRFKDQG